MIRKLSLASLVILSLAVGAIPARAGNWIFEEHYLLGLGWTNKYRAVAPCPGGRPHPWNPFHSQPIHSSLGLTGPRRMMLWNPTLKAPLYNNTPRLVPIPPEYRVQKGNCPYIIGGPGVGGAVGANGHVCQECQHLQTSSR